MSYLTYLEVTEYTDRCVLLQIGVCFLLLWVSVIVYSVLLIKNMLHFRLEFFIISKQV